MDHIIGAYAQSAKPGPPALRSRSPSRLTRTLRSSRRRVVSRRTAAPALANDKQVTSTSTLTTDAQADIVDIGAVSLPASSGASASDTCHRGKTSGRFCGAGTARRTHRRGGMS